MTVSIHRHALALALSLAALPAAAQEGAGMRLTTMELRAGRDALTNGVAPWEEQSIALRYRHTARAGFGLSAERLQRFGMEDRRVMVELSAPMGRRLTVGGEGELSPTHRVAARQGGAAFVHVALPAGWGVDVRGLARTYDSATVHGGSASLEKYWGNQMLSYTVSPVRMAGNDGTMTTHRVRLTHYFGEAGSLSVMGSAGDEVETLSAAGPLVAPVRAAGVWGVLPVAPHLALTYAADVSRHEGLFTRRHASLGVRIGSR
ncbi:MAG: YaiO family outer membrane beta-barrel protein [Gemmatimonadota bacterium]